MEKKTKLINDFGVEDHIIICNWTKKSDLLVKELHDQSVEKKRKAQGEANVEYIAAQGIGHGIIGFPLLGVSYRDDGVGHAGRHGGEDHRDEEGRQAQADVILPQKGVSRMRCVPRAEPLTGLDEEPAGASDDRGGGQ